MAVTKAKKLLEVSRYFLKLGTLGFGGPLALMASMQRDLVEKRKWIDQKSFTQALALIKAMPGPVASQLAIYVGRRRAGWWGGLLAGLMLILPAFIMMIALALGYTQLTSHPVLQTVLKGMQAGAVGVIADSIWRLTRPYRSAIPFWILVLAVLPAIYFFPNAEPVFIFGAGIFWLVIRSHIVRSTYSSRGFIELGALSTLTLLILVMLKSGGFVFGTGLAIVPLLKNEVVTKYHWLTNQEFLDALAFGQVTPGPVMITATFIGFKTAGIWGAILGTIAIFFPSFFNMLTWFPWLERKVAGSPKTAHFIFGAIAAVIASLVLALSNLSHQLEPRYLLLAAAALTIALTNKLPSWLLIILCGISGPVFDLARF